MNFYTIYSDSHEKLLLNYLLPSISSESLTIKKMDQYCETGSFYSKGWSHACYQKVLYFYDICKKEFNGVFLFTDVDVQFFLDPTEQLLLELEDYDIACQDDINQSCSGLFVCRSNIATLNMFEAMIDGYEKEDQFTLNKYLSMVRNKRLSHRFFNIAHFTGRTWDHKDFDIPTDIIAHHANWTVGVESKIELLKIVKNKYDLLRR